jgi:hypothetical protein
MNRYDPKSDDDDDDDDYAADCTQVIKLFIQKFKKLNCLVQCGLFNIFKQCFQFLNLNQITGNLKKNIRRKDEYLRNR